MHGDARSLCRLLCVACCSATRAQVLALVGAPEYDTVGFPTVKLEDLRNLRYDAKRSSGSYYALGAIVNHQPESHCCKGRGGCQLTGRGASLGAAVLVQPAGPRCRCNLRRPACVPAPLVGVV